MEGTQILYFIGPLIGGVILYLIIKAVVKAPGAVKNAQFANLGVLKGKTYDEIKAKVGPCNAQSASTSADGVPVTIRQWISTGYHIVLLFDQNDVCLGISSETKV
ncbi:MAG: hypothetical protein IJM20_03760 [Clostridia bacterium]|jgi:hypothetical protein|nr:hypothetical protein [Clostridia bacterium]